MVALLGLVKNQFAGALFRFIAAGCFIVSAVFFFLSINFCLPNKDASYWASSLSNILSSIGIKIKDIKDNLVLAAGAIIGGITAGLAGLCELAAVFLKK